MFRRITSRTIGLGSRPRCGAVALASVLRFGCADQLMASDDSAALDGDDAESKTQRASVARTQTQATQDDLDQTETPLPDGIPTDSGRFEHRGRAGVIETVADATSESSWAQLDLDTAEQSDDRNAWDLAFSRQRVRINAGLSGPGSVEVAVSSEDFDAVDSVPEADAFMGETPDSEGEEGDADSDPDNAFNSAGDDWFLYDLKTHTLTPREVTYVVKSTEERYFKLRIVSYYDEHGSPGVFTLRWLELEDTR